MSADAIFAVVLAAIAIVAVLARLVGSVFVKLRQPPVVGEIMLGIALGPTLLGLILHGGSTGLLPAGAASHLSVIAQFGLVMFMFLIGAEFNTDLIRGRGRLATIVSFSSVTLPLGLGALLAIWLATNNPPPNGMRLPFFLFIGAAMSVTAFPVLARILKERGLDQSPVGALAMTVAAVDDVLAWTLLAIVAAITHADGTGGLLLVIVGATVYVAFMFLVIRPCLTRIGARYRRAGRLEPSVLVLVVAGALISAGVTSAIGLHAIFGAFLFGALLPGKGAPDLVPELLLRLEPIVIHLLLPLFFVVTGMFVNVMQLTATGWVQLLAVVAVACVSKFTGATAAALAFRLTWRDSATLGVLMNTRGLTELVILSVGRELGVIGDQLFTIMVLMAVATTVMASPLLGLLGRRQAQPILRN